MLEWIVTICILTAVVLFWPVTMYFASSSQSPGLLSGLGRRISRCQIKRPDRCVSDSTAVPTATIAAMGEAETVALICKPSALAKYLHKHCVTFCNFAAASRWDWRANPFLQTVLGACWPSESAVHFVRDHLQMSDSGLVALDWAVAGSAPHKRRRTSSNSTSPVLLIIPNSFGKITWNVLKLCDVALSHGYVPVVFNRRGQNGTPLSTPRLQQFGDPADLREAVRYIRYRRPVGRLYAVSEGTGSGLLLSYLGECGSSSYLTAAACLSPVFRCQGWFESSPCWPFHWVLLLYQKACLSRYRTALEEATYTDSLFSCSSLRSLEEALFCLPSGREGGGAGCSWEEYWERNDPLRDVDEVAVPVLCVCSRDDPVRGEPSITLPLELFESNPHFFLLLTGRGGHCGFFTPGEGEGGVPWSHRALLEFFRGTTDFFAGEERAQLAARRRGLRGGVSAVTIGNARGFRHRSISTCKRLPACSHSIHAIYSWQRSYTR
ncbi:protein ABHD15-like [Megalops cyprinoides]|uniref:protein ABHD15-like n=1 Tax=Megalops cyprinoides TaxID=118141 RepID=UPI001864A874|nr:protein ABHD15-like [Megalops cyprinoides]